MGCKKMAIKENRYWHEHLMYKEKTHHSVLHAFACTSVASITLSGGPEKSKYPAIDHTVTIDNSKVTTLITLSAILVCQK